MKYILILLLVFGCIGCASCSRSGKKKIMERSREKPESKYTAEQQREQSLSPGKTEVKMKYNNGVYEVPVEVNGVPLYFIFDTGASTVTISATEASFLWKNGKLKKKDIRNTQHFTDAQGEITEGLIINLSEVKIGGKTLYDVEAAVINTSQAPLLLGQSVLSRFGRVSIDYNNSKIVFGD